MSDVDPRAELSGLVTAFAEHLRRATRRGQLWVPAAASPRGEPTSRAAVGAAPLAEAAPASAELAMAAEREALGAAPVAAASAAVESGVSGVPEADLARVREELGDCRRCRLADERKHLVFGVGNAAAELMVIGEAPGRDEDLQGEPFVGAAGQLLTKMLKAMGLERSDVYITNILKCRPPKNRDPERDEVESCEPFLRKQIDAIGPRIIIAMGNFAAKTLLRTTTGITRLRGTFYTYHGIPVMPTFHPAYLLRNPDGKRPAWADLQTVMREMDRLGLYRRRDG